MDTSIRSLLIAAQKTVGMIFLIVQIQVCLCCNRKKIQLSWGTNNRRLNVQSLYQGYTYVGPDMWSRYMNVKVLKELL